MTLHLIALPHAPKEYEQCAFGRKVRDFPEMMKPYYEVVTYGSNHDVTCITPEQQAYFLSEYEWYKQGRYYEIPFNDELPIWRFFIKNMIKELKKRYSVGDLILISSPIYYKPIMREFTEAKIVEYGIGYPTVLAPYRVFESEGWRNYCYGHNPIPDHGYMNDIVIPNFYNVDNFSLVTKKEDYLLFMGRPIPSKGIAWVQILAAQGHKIKVAGSREVTGKNIEWVGYVDGKQKAELMGKAKALLSPTMYLEPFGGVVAEAALCGTPSLTTNWGCYIETVEHGKTGFRANNLTELSSFIDKLDTLDYKYISKRAKSLWSTDVVGKQYNDYFKRLA